MDAENMTDGTPASSCWACGALVPRGNNYCGRCGQGQGRFVSWYYRHSGAVLLALFAGPFALYFIWRSPVLSRAAKWGYTAGVLLLTWYAVSSVLGFIALLREASSALQL